MTEAPYGFMTKAVKEIIIQNAIADNAFFHDFLLFLEEAGRQPFRLTKTGHLRLADIHSLGEHFAQEIYRRNGLGELERYIQSEREVRPLMRIRLMAQHMRLTALHHGTLQLSIWGKAFLAKTPLQTQFEELILWYLQRYNWAEWYAWQGKIASALQGAQRFLWRYFLYRKDTEIAYPQFLSGLRRYFGLDALVTDPSSFYDPVQWAVDRMLVKDLRLFGLLSVDSVPYDSVFDSEIISAFQPTALGVHIFQLALRTPG